MISLEIGEEEAAHVYVLKDYLKLLVAAHLLLHYQQTASHVSLLAVMCADECKTFLLQKTFNEWISSTECTQNGVSFSVDVFNCTENIFSVI